MDRRKYYGYLLAMEKKKSQLDNIHGQEEARQHNGKGRASQQRDGQCKI